MANEVHWKLLNANSVQFFFSLHTSWAPQGGLPHTLGTTALMNEFVLYFSLFTCLYNRSVGQTDGIMYMAIRHQESPLSACWIPNLLAVVSVCTVNCKVCRRVLKMKAAGHTVCKIRVKWNLSQPEITPVQHRSSICSSRASVSSNAQAL
jgi:hypothetical protein